ncbi:conjugative transposon protein TraM [uncultured Dysgonomonas sp.]|uniref:conjugative transposon protein TraM n=1 Tax=uncultured Dysgonomonas sp. TaxID=206096 RepID=UPI000A49A852|nr:conjugative transposon protein TraM [uncultured Dysgonomonas sp.]
MEKQASQFEKRRKMLLVMPLIALPFITLIFWAMGGGKEVAVAQQQQGINKELPGAQLEDESLDKMSLYSRLEPDTTVKSTADSIHEGFTADEIPGYSVGDPYGGLAAYSSSGYNDPNESRVRGRLAELERLMQQQNDLNAGSSSALPEEEHSMARLEQMMARMNGQEEADPELQALNGMLDKIINIQNPDHMREKLREQSLEHRGAVFAVSRLPRKNTVPYLQKPAPDSMLYDEALFQPTEYSTDKGTVEVLQMKTHNSFYGIDAKKEKNSTELTAIPAVIHETQTLVSGSNLKMRLTEDIYVNGILIPTGSFLSGKCTLNGERLQVTVDGIRYQNYLLPVKLQAFDLDGMAGIRIPGAISRDAAKDGTDRAIQSMQFMSLDPSIATQAAGAGVEAVKGLLSKKAKLVKVTVKAGHPVLLFDEQSKNN